MSQAVADRDTTPPRYPYRWMMLAEAVRLATAPQILFLSLLGAVLVWCGWLVSGILFSPAVDRDTGVAYRLHEYVSRWPGEAGPSEGLAQGLAKFIPVPEAYRPAAPIDPVVGVPYRLAEPFRRLLSVRNSWSSVGYYLLGGVCSLAVWALLGGAITRAAVVRFGLAQRLSIRESLSFALGKWTAYFTAPLLPLAGIVLMAVPLVLLGWLMRLDVGVVIAGLLWIVVLVNGLLMALLGLGLLFGWPLMWGTISTENSDAFDAISRSYAYTFQRPLCYLFYALVAAALGTLAWLLAWGFSEAVISLGYWGISWGAGSERLREIQEISVAGPAGQGVLGAGAWIIAGFVSLTRATASAFSYAYFWCVAGAAYLLLRRDTDQTDLEEVVTSDTREEAEGLPPLEPDEAGVPGVSGEKESAPGASSDP